MKKTDQSIFFLLLALLVSAISLLQLPYFTELPHTDAQVYALGAKICSTVGLLYRDFFDHKGPFFYLLNILGYKMIPGYGGMVLVEGILLYASIVILYLGLKRRFSSCKAVIVVSLLLLSKEFSFHLYPEFIAWIFGVASVGVLLMSNSWRSWLLIGFMGGCVFLSKQTCIGIYVGLAVMALLQAWKRRKYNPLAMYVLGGVCCIALALATLACFGILSDWFNCTFWFNAIYSSENTGADFLPRLIKFVSYLRWRIVLVLLSIALLFRISKPIDRNVIAGWIVMLLWETLFLFKTGRFYDYQFSLVKLILFMPVCLFVCNYNRDCNIKTVLLKLAWIGVICLYILRPFGCNVTYRANCALHGLERDEAGKVSDAIKALPDSRLFVWGNCCRLYLETDRQCPVPYYYWAPFLYDEFLTDGERSARIKAIVSAGPIAIVDNITQGKETCKFYDELMSWVRTHCRKVKISGSDCDLWTNNLIDGVVE